jgi:hypothetical protein
VIFESLVIQKISPQNDGLWEFWITEAYIFKKRKDALWLRSLKGGDKSHLSNPFFSFSTTLFPPQTLIVSAY